MPTEEEKMKVMLEEVKRFRAVVASMAKFLDHMEVGFKHLQAVDMEGFEVVALEDMEEVVDFIATAMRVFEEDQGVEPVQ